MPANWSTGTSFGFMGVSFGQDVAVVWECEAFTSYRSFSIGASYMPVVYGASTVPGNGVRKAYEAKVLSAIVKRNQYWPLSWAAS